MSNVAVESGSSNRLRQARTALKVIVPLLLFAGALLALAGGGQQLLQYRIAIQPGLAAASFLVLVVPIGWASLVWTYMARMFGAALGWRSGVKVYATSNLGKYLPGKVGHVVARIYLAQERGVPLVVGTTAAVVDIVLYVAAALSCGILALPLFFPQYGELATAAGLGCVLVGLALLHPRVLNAILGGLARKLPGGTRFHLECGYSAILRLYGLYLVLILLTTLGMLLSLSALQPLPLAAGAKLGAIYGVSYLAGLVFPLAPNGVGIREGVMATLLSGLMPVAAAGAASILFRVLQVSAEALYALVASRL
jgi:uncharacterized membrane protein YbhN (UPF0104 family)